MITECAGILGAHPDPWTMREIVAAADARKEADWWHTASIQALIANIARRPHSPAASPYDFHPTAVKPKTEISIEELEKLLSGKG